MSKKTEVLSLFGFSILAFFQPLFNLLSQYPEFFTSHKIEPNQLFAFVAILFFVLPLSLVVVYVFVSLINRRLQALFHLSMLAALCSIIVLIMLNDSGLISAPMSIGLSVLAALLLVLSYQKFEALRFSITILGLITFFLPLTFLFSKGIQDIAFPSALDKRVENNQALPIPIVFIIFDEFTSNSLVNKQGEIDSKRYPNIAWFAERSHWFSNASTVADGTAYAVPAILSGQYAKRSQPTYQAYPVNIFSLLQDSHTFNAHESASKLCPPEACQAIDVRRSFQQQLTLIIADALVIYAHTIVPKAYAAKLPDISQGWVNYLAPVNGDDVTPNKTDNEEDSDRGWLLNLILSYLEDDRGALWQRFLDSIPNTPQPSLNLIHILLPHVALEYLPSGKNYGRQLISGLKDETWNNDDWAVKQGWQRHLLQLAYTDKLLGDLFKTLESEQLFDKSLVIITADHGLSFKTNVLRRPISDDNYMDILPVPLFIKLPGQNEGKRSSANVETVDILSTIVDVLNISPPDSLEGISVFETQKLAARKEKTIFTFHKGERTLKYPAQLEARKTVIGERLRLFGDSANEDGIYALGTDKDLIGRQVKKSLPYVAQAYELSLKNNANERIYSLETGPNFVSGSLLLKGSLDGKLRSLDGPVRLALTINQEIKAVTKTYLQTDEAELSFAFLVPESAYLSNENMLAVYQIQETNSGEKILHQFHKEKLLPYALKESFLLSESGEEFTITSESVMGFLDTVTYTDGLFYFSGWAVDKGLQKQAAHVALFVGDQFVSSVQPRLSRPDVAEAYGISNYKYSGYELYTRIDRVQKFCRGELKVYGISEDGFATKLSFPSERINLMNLAACKE